MFDNFKSVVTFLIFLIRNAFTYEFFNLLFVRFFVKSKTLSSFFMLTFIFLLFNLFFIFALA